jgi:hypothetical protein
MYKNVTIFAALLGAVMLGQAPARAATINYDFAPTPTGVVPSGSENSSLGTTDSFTSGGYTIHAAGFGNTFSSGANISTGSTVDLYAKNGGGDEEGLGLTNDPSGDHEISGSSLIEISLPGQEASFSFQMGSTTNGEGWLVFGSDSQSSGFVQVDSGTDESSHTLTGTNGDFQYYYFAFNPADFNWQKGNTNVLLADVDFNVSATPIPGTLPLFATGIVGLVALRRKRKAATTAA